MTQFRTRKSDKQAFPINQKSGASKSNISPQVVGYDKSQIEKNPKPIVNPEYDLSTQYDSRKSFYEKAKVRTEDGKTILRSYNTDVAYIENGKVVVKGSYSSTTLRHIKEFLKQHGFKADTSKQIIKDYPETQQQEQKEEKERTDSKDSDGDGIPDSKDCEPFNPKKQGVLHDIAVNLLKKREQKLENERLEQMKKLEEVKEKLNQQKAIQSEKNAKLQQKQSIIDEINDEKKKIDELKQANKIAKKEIFDESPVGKVIKRSSEAINKTQEFLNKPKTKKVINRLFVDTPKRRHARRKVRHKKVKHKKRKKAYEPYITI